MPAHAFANRPTLASRYDEETRALVAARLRVCCWLALPLIPVFLALDGVLHPQLLPVFAVIRATMLAVALLVLLALRHERGTRHATTLSLATFLHTGLAIVLMTAFNGGGSSPYYAGVNLVMLAAAVLMPWELPVSITCCATLVAAYAVSCVIWAGVPDGRAFVGNLFFLCATAIITVVSHVVGAAARRHEFLQRLALEDAGRHRDEFLANVTHELRTPLAAILGFSEMLADYTTDAGDAQRAWLTRIRENALTLYRLIVQLLDFSKIEAGSMEVGREPVRIDEIVAKVVGDMRAIAGAEGTEVSVRVELEAATVLGDAGRVEEIVTNLASNALKFSGGKPILLRVTGGALDDDPAWQRIVPEPGPDAIDRAYIRVEVTDHGSGIRRDDLRRLFVTFQQLDGSSTRRHGGTGLGLAISARLAGAMRGHVAVRSTPEKGSTFALLMPRIEPADIDARPHPDARDADQSALAVLVADRCGIMRSSGPL